MNLYICHSVKTLPARVFDADPTIANVVLVIIIRTRPIAYWRIVHLSTTLMVIMIMMVIQLAYCTQ